MCVEALFASMILKMGNSKLSEKVRQVGSFGLSCHVQHSGEHNGKLNFTTMSLHINKHHAKKRGIAKKVLIAVRVDMCQEQVDMVVGDLNGVA